MRRIFLFSTLCILATFAGSAVAQTPDGETPANEGVCDELLGGTPGLYGLCVAFCEAQDLDGVDIDDPDTVFKKAPKNKLLQNYRNKMRDGDPDMPCVQAPCPCWSEEQIAQIGGRGREYEFCFDVNLFDVYGYDYDYVQDFTSGYPDSLQPATLALVYDWNLDLYPYPATEAQCWWVDYVYDWSVGDYIQYDVVSLNISQEEHAACVASVQDHAAAAGITCQVYP